MKKNYFLLAASTMMFAACAQTDLVNEVVTEEAPQAIGFETFAEKVTRGEINQTSDLESVDEGQFTVWGWKTQTDNTVTPIFEGQEVNWDATKGWTYSPIKYWDKTATYEFYAVAPKKGAATYELNNKKFIIEDVASGAANSTTYYLITRNAHSHSGASGGTVNFTFSHIMSKITIKVQQGTLANNKVVTLTDLNVSGWNKNTGTFTQDKTTQKEVNGVLKDVVCEWDLNDDISEIGQYDFLKSGSEDVSTKKKIGESYLMVPQENVDLKFTISYMIGTETFLAHEATIQDQTWEPNTHYIYTITVGPDEILFDVDDIASWTDDSNGSTTIE